MKFNYIFAIIIVCFVCQNSFCQGKSIDSLMNLSYDELKGAYFESDDISIKENIAHSYIDKAREANDTIYIARGYYLYANLYDPLTNIKYADTIIQLTKDKDHKSYPAVGYLLRGYYYYDLSKHKEVSDNYLIAYEYAVKHNKEDQKKTVRDMMGQLKNKSGDHKGALKIYKEEYESIIKDKNFRENHQEDYLIFH